MALRLYVFWALTWAAWTWLALGKTPADSPEWLLRTREVCFGSFSDGLPQAHGWVSLAAPIPMLIALLALCGAELRQQWKRLPWLLGLLLAALPVGTLGYSGARAWQGWQLRQTLQARPAALPLPPDYPQWRGPLVQFGALRDGQGAPVQPPSRPWVLTFAYAHCQTVCPTLLQTVRALPADMPAVIVTLDPWRDTCGSLGGLGKHWQVGPNVRLLSGPEDAVGQLTRALEVPTKRDPNTGEIDHPALVFLIDGQGRARYRFLNPSVEWLLEGANRLEDKG